MTHLYIDFFSGISRSFCHLSKDHTRSKSWENKNPMAEVPIPTGTVGLPPNVVFEPKESEPFTLQTVCTIKPSKQFSKEENNYKDSGYSFFLFILSPFIFCYCFLFCKNHCLDFAFYNIGKERYSKASFVLYFTISTFISM